MSKSNNKLSYSRMYKYLHCRYEYKLHYLDGLRRRGKVAIPLEFGTLGHAGMEAAFLYKAKHQTAPVSEIVNAGRQGVEAKVKENFDKGCAETKEQVQDLWEDVESQVIGALEWIDLDRWEVVKHPDTGEPLVEIHLETEVGGGWDCLQAYVDLVLRNKANGNVFVVDHKFRKAFQDYDKEETAVQFTIYQKLLETLGLDFSGVITFQIKSKPPSVPKTTKAGGISRAKVACSWESYKGFVLAMGLDPADYAEMEYKLANVEFFRLTYSHRSIEEIEGTWENVRNIAAEMKFLESGHLGPIRNLKPGPMGCASCSMKELCLAELRGEDADYIRKSRYRHYDDEDTVFRPEDVILLEDE